MTKLVFGTFLGALLGPLLGACSSRMHGGEPALPPPPALGAQIERVGRPLIANALLGPLASEDDATRAKERYNRARPDAAAPFIAAFEAALALYDGYDGACGNQWLAGRNADPALRYHTLALVLGDDRLWLDSRVARCDAFLAVEHAWLDARDEPGDRDLPADCGGRSLTVDSNNAFRSLVVRGAPTGAGDGVHADDRAPSPTFPFLVAP